VARLGRPRDVRCTWLADGEPGRVVVKLRENPFAADRVAWVAEVLALLRADGYPVPEPLWSGELDQRWFAAVHTALPGEPLAVLDPRQLDALLALVELQASAAPRSGGWDLSWWIGVVLFEGWERWWELTEAAAPETAARLHAFLEPAWGHRLPVG